MKFLLSQNKVALLIISISIFILSSFSLFNYTQRKEASDQARSLRYTLSLYNKISNNLAIAQSGARGYIFTGRQEFLDEYFTATEEAFDAAKELKKSSSSTKFSEIVAATELEIEKINSLISLKNNSNKELLLEQVIADNWSWRQLQSLIKRESIFVENKIIKISNSNRDRVNIDLRSQLMLIVLFLLLFFLSAKVYSEQEVEKQIIKLDFKREVKGIEQYIYEIVAHELKVPLQIIVLYLALLQKDGVSPERVESAYKKIDDAIARIVNIVDTMIFLSSDFQPAFKVEDVTIVCKIAIEQMKELTPGSFITENIPSYPVTLSIHEPIFTSFLCNLISNAIKYSPSGKPVVVGVDQDDKDNVIITITDYGIGIPKEELDKLFKPFFRASNVGQIKGTGLGLLVAKKSVEMHGGVLTVSSVLGVGTSFVASLPKQVALKR